MANGPIYKLRLARTLYHDFYRAHVMDEDGKTVGVLQILPALPLDRSEVPADAPEVKPYLTIIVEDADINKENLIDFEERTSLALLKRFTTETVAFNHCEFYYPSPAFVIQDDPSATQN